RPMPPTPAAAPANGQEAAAPRPDWPRFRSRDRVEGQLPPLHSSPARPMVRDRWEWLVTRVETSAAPEKVWRALTDPAALRRWLAVCHGSLEQVDQDVTLDFEDGEFFLCRPTVVRGPHHLEYIWRWLGIGQATSVAWHLERCDVGTQVTVTE